MAYREVTRVEIQEIIRRWQAGEGYRRIATGTGLSRNTVRKYLTAARVEGIGKDGAAPTADQLSRLATMGQSGPRQPDAPSEELLVPWADQIYQWLTGDRLLMTRIHELLVGWWVPGVLPVSAALHSEAQLESADKGHGAHGGHSAGRGGGGGLRPAGDDP